MQFLRIKHLKVLINKKLQYYNKIKIKLQSLPLKKKKLKEIYV